MRFQIGTSKGSGGRRYNPRVFTEQEVYMLATTLKSPKAIQVTLDIMDTFVAMRKYIGSNLLVQNNINNMVIRHDNDIKELQNAFKQFEEKKMKL